VIIFLLNVYLVILFIIVRLHIVRVNLFWKASPFLVLAFLLVGLFIPMGWGAPSGPIIVGRHSVSIVPDVAGEVTDVTVEPNKPVKAGSLLFQIDPTPYEAQVKALDAKLTFARLRLSQMSYLEQRDAGRNFDVQQREAEVKELEASLEGAQWNLTKTSVRAPTDGFVTNLALRKGARVSNLAISPVMAFIDTSETILLADINQIDARFIEAGQPVEIAFKLLPGQIVTGKVETLLQAISTGQEAPSGLAATPKELKAAPFLVRISLDDETIAQTLPAGSTGTVAIFTDHVKVAHVIRRVLLRQQALLNYLIPF